MKKTDSGIIIEITHEKNGCLEQGGWSGRQVLVNFSSIGMNPEESLEAVINEHGTKWADVAYEYARSTEWSADKVLKKGSVVK